LYIGVETRIRVQRVYMEGDLGAEVMQWEERDKEERKNSSALLN
jgi:hypothetical protein